MASGWHLRLRALLAGSKAVALGVDLLGLPEGDARLLPPGEPSENAAMQRWIFCSDTMGIKLHKIMEVDGAPKGWA